MALPVPVVWAVLEAGGRWSIVFDRVKASSYMTGAELVIDGGKTGGARRRWT